jgi:hypothetical protein
MTDGANVAGRHPSAGRAAPPGRAGAPSGRPTAPSGRLSGLRVPAHVGVLLGASTAAYAVTLAAITGLQATSEAELAAERAPAVAGVQNLGARNQDLGNALAAAGQRYDSLAREYAAAGGQLSSLEAALADLASSVQAIDGVSRSLPASVPLPKVTRVTVSGAPATSSTTGASGVP